MDIDLIITAILGSLWLLIMILRTNVSLAIMGLCAGYVFSDLLSDEIVSLAFDNINSISALPVISVVSITLTLAPSILILFRFKAHQKRRYIQHIIPAAGFALLACVLIFSNLPLETTRYLREESVAFQQYEAFKVLIPAAVVGIALVDIVIHDNEHRRKYKRKHKV